MSLKKDFQWTTRSHSVKGLIHNYVDRLPIIVKVVQGFCGIDDDDEYAYSTDEIYRLSEVKIQNKLIFSNGQKQQFSIPENYHCRFQILYDRGQRSSLMSLDALQDKLDLGMKVEIENDDLRTFKIPVLGDSQVVSCSLGVLQYDDFYEERVLIGRPLIDAIPQPEEVFIPSFVDLQLVLASGLMGGTDYDYDKVCADIGEMCASFNSTQVQSNEEIMLVTCDIDELSEEYKNVTPVHYVRCDQVIKSREVQKTVASLRETMTDSEVYAYKSHPPPGLQSPVEKYPLPAPSLVQNCEDEDQDDLDYEMPSTITPSKPSAPPILVPLPEHLKKAHTLNRANLRLPAPPPDGSHHRSTRQSVSPQSPSPVRPNLGKASTFTYLEAKKSPMRHDYVNTVNPASLEQRATGFDIYSSIDDLDSVDLDLDDLDSKDDYVDMTSALGISRPFRKPARSASSTSSTTEENPYGSFADVPAQVSGMTVAEVASCLRLMNLEKHVDRFTDEQVDGNMLLDLDTEMLLNDFNFTNFECKKLLKFVREGWRPKQQVQL